MKIKFFGFLIILSLILVACGQQTEDAVIFRTADPRINIAFRLLPLVDAPALPTVTPAVVPDVVPTEEVGEVLPDPTPEPPCEIIKGNISRSGEKIAHSPGQSNYDSVKIDEGAGEKFFCSLKEAEYEGWRAARN